MCVQQMFYTYMYVYVWVGYMKNLTFNDGWIIL